MAEVPLRRPTLLQVDLSDAEKRSKELSWQVKMMSEGGGPAAADRQQLAASQVRLLCRPQAVAFSPMAPAGSWEHVHGCGLSWAVLEAWGLLRTTLLSAPSAGGPCGADAGPFWLRYQLPAQVTGRGVSGMQLVAGIRCPFGVRCCSSYVSRGNCIWGLLEY